MLRISRTAKPAPTSTLSAGPPPRRRLSVPLRCSSRDPGFRRFAVATDAAALRAAAAPPLLRVLRL
jgi:hypothetical protein